MYSSVVILLLFVMVACIDVRVCAQDNTPNNVPMPPPPSELTPRPLPPPPGVPNLQLDPVKPMPKETPADCGPTKHWGGRGCVDGAPRMGVTEIQGIPVDEAIGILERHRDELHKIPGVMGSGLGVDGIILDVLPKHGDIPATIEGLPVQTQPYSPAELLHHTVTTRVRPVHGSVLYGPMATIPQADCTLTTVVLAHGDPWIISAAHCLLPLTCPANQSPPNCPTGTELWQCPRYNGWITDLFQPASPGSLNDIIGWVQRYTLSGGTPQNTVRDAFAAAMDNNQVDRDRSLWPFLLADRRWILSWNRMEP